MKIGILTFHCAHNYGAILQCYALQEILKNMGHEVKIIDYRPSFLIRPYKVFYIRRFISKNPIKMLTKCIRELLILNIRRKRYKVFIHSITKMLNLSEPVKNKNIPSNFEVYIMGSDQIWNPRISRGFDNIYFGFLPFEKKNRKYISYAASMESSCLTSEQSTYYSKALNNFDSISVREKNLADLLQPLTKLTIHIVLDPTLLANSVIWDNIIKAPTKKNRYVLIYQIRENDNTLHIAKHIAAQLQAEVITLCSFPTRKKQTKTIQDASPEEFLGWIKYASCIITTSFHGTAFSIIFRKPFYCLKLNDGNDNRTTSLLKQIGLMDRLIEKESLPIFSEIDYRQSVNKLEELRQNSHNYLKNNI